MDEPLLQEGLGWGDRDLFWGDRDLFRGVLDGSGGRTAAGLEQQREYADQDRGSHACVAAERAADQPSLPMLPQRDSINQTSANPTTISAMQSTSCGSEPLTVWNSAGDTGNC